MTPDEHNLRDTARSLAWLYRLLDAKKYDAPPLNRTEFSGE